jgi:spore germination cell wall hydrolase CwlJ-like protein
MKSQLTRLNSYKTENTIIVIQTSLCIFLILMFMVFNQAVKSILNNNFPFESAAPGLQGKFHSSFHLLKNDAANFLTNNQTVQATKTPHKDLTGLQCLALNIYFEARGESEIGQRAVGHVVLNRVANHKFPKTICDVIRQGGEQRLYRCQFSWWCDGRSDKPKNNLSWQNALRIAKYIANGNSVDPTGGALWYHAEYVTPYWRTAFLEGPTIGSHIFYLAQTRQS